MKKKSRIETAQRIFSQGVLVTAIGMAISVCVSEWFLLLTAVGLLLSAWAVWWEGK